LTDEIHYLYIPLPANSIPFTAKIHYLQVQRPGCILRAC